MVVPGLGHFSVTPWLGQRAHSRCEGCTDGQGATIAQATELSGHVSVTTIEGDRVTLSAAWRESFQGATYNHLVRRGDIGFQFQQTLAGSESRGDIGFIVEGELNAEERRDLTALFRSVGSVFEQFYRGQTEEGLEQTVGVADAFGEWASLSSLAFDLHVQRSVTVAAAGQSVIDSAAPSRGLDTPGVAPQAAAAIPSSSLGTTAPTQLSIPSSEPRPEVLARQLLDLLDSAQFRRREMRDLVSQLLERADRRAKERREPDSDRAAVAAQARERVLERMNEPAARPRAVVTAFSYSHTVVNHSRYATLA